MNTVSYPLFPIINLSQITFNHASRFEINMFRILAFWESFWVSLERLVLATVFCQPFVHYKCFITGTRYGFSLANLNYVASKISKYYYHWACSN